MPTLQVLEAGPGLSLQDHGRPGFQRYGVTEGGAMDRTALAEVNCLTGNSIDTAAIEMIALGGRFSVTEHAVTVACSGALMDTTVDGKPVPWRSSFVLQPGQVLQCGYAQHSIYGYLQVAGGFMLSPVMDSISTHVRSGFGGFQGRVLQAGDQLPVTSVSNEHPPARLLEPDYLNTGVIRVMWGSQSSAFSERVRGLLLNSEFNVSSQRDRMGARLATEAGSLAAESGLRSVSDAVVIGDVQIAGDGVATVLLADRQPTGGYPRIATVITADIDAIAQMPTGKRFCFELVSAEAAVMALKQKRESLQQLHKKLLPMHRAPEDVPDLLKYNLVDGVINPL